MYKNKRNVGAHDCAQKGITLIALVITIIVMLILVAVTISMAVNGGLFEYAGKAVGDTQNEIDAEQALANGKIKVGNTWYDSIDDYLNNIPSGTQSGEITDGEGTEEDPYEGQTADFTEEIGKVNSADVIAYFYQKDNGNYDLVIRGEGEMKFPGYASDCSGLFSTYGVEAVYVTEGVTNIEGLLYGTSGLYPNTTLSKVVLSNTVTSIGNDAFQNCQTLEELTIPNSVTSIGNNAFKGCTSLTELTIPNSVTSIGNNAFEGCTSLTEITIPDGVTSWGYGAFYGCYNLKTATIGEGLATIEQCTFYQCGNLVSVTIPSTVTKIEAMAFLDCDSLETVYYAGTQEQWDSINIDQSRPDNWLIGDYDGNASLTNATIICTGE